MLLSAAASAQAEPEFFAFDGAGNRVDLARSHASISRQLPRALGEQVEFHDVDSDALRWLAVGPSDALPRQAKIVSTRPDGQKLDELGSVALTPVACPMPVTESTSCRQTKLIRASSDEIDRSHPQAADRSILAEVGGRLSVLVEGRKAAAIRVGGPRHTRLGPLARYRGVLRTHIVRARPGGPPPIGADDREAVEFLRKEIAVTSRLWGQCGVHFGQDAELSIEVVDPPPPYLLAIGCELGLPASGGTLRFAVGDRTFELETKPRQSPFAVAGALEELLEASGLDVAVSYNAKIQPGALRTADVLVRTAGGEFATIRQSGKAPFSDDPTLSVCLGDVQLSDGLTHFDDFNAAAGTLEERALIKAYDDGDPTTIEVFIVPNFTHTGRIGESFIFADGASIQNTVLLDRAGLLAGARSYALAHELGHILLDMPGHPDDYGIDRSSWLMDADAADGTIFGPRRLSIPECERALRQSGPEAPVPLLREWPLVAPDRHTRE